MSTELSPWLHDPVSNTHIKRLADKQEEFLERIVRWEETDSEACHALGIHRMVLEKWKENAEFVRRLQVARMDLIDKLEKEAVRRALKGVEEDVYYQGDVVGQKQNYSDSLMQTLLKGLKPEIYGDKREINANIKMFSIVDVLTSMRRYDEDASRTIHQESQDGKAEAPVGARLPSPKEAGQGSEDRGNVGKRRSSKGSSQAIPQFVKPKKK